MKEEGVKKEIKIIKKYYGGGTGGAFYGLGLIGALFYYLQPGGNFEAVMLGIVKAILWPAFLVYEVYKTLGM